MDTKHQNLTTSATLPKNRRLVSLNLRRQPHNSRLCSKCLDCIRQCISANRGSRPEFKMHNGFPQLQIGAANCDFCRLIERTILLKLSAEEESQLLRTKSSEEIMLKLHYAAFDGHSDAINDLPLDFRLQVTVGKGAPSTLDKGIMAYHSNVWKDNNMASRFVNVDANPYNRAIYNKTSSWLDACQNGHKRCENLVWSYSKPTTSLRLQSRISYS